MKLSIPNSVLTFMIFTACATAHGATTYRWEDEQGIIHFTDDYKVVPKRYLPVVKEDLATGTFSGSAAQGPIEPAAPAAAPVRAGKSPENGAEPTRRAKIAQELKALQKDLVGKKEELARLRHRWTVAKGRLPKAGEIKSFEKKRAKGEAKYEDNPYVNNSPLSSPAPARHAYFEKLAEVQKEEEKIRQLQQEIEALERGGKGTGPAD